MATLVFGMNVSLDVYVDHDKFAPGVALFQHFIDQTRGLTGSIYGRGLYELMRYWDEDQPGWTADDHDFAVAWRRLPKWVVSRSTAPVGPDATLVTDDLAVLVRGLKDRLGGQIEVGGPELAHSLTTLGLIDAYHLYIHPVVLGQGRRYFAGPPPTLRLVSSDVIDGAVVRLIYAPA